MTCESRDLTIESALADPMIQAVMRADRVKPTDVQDLLRGKARQMRGMPFAPLLSPGLLAQSARAAARRACFA